MKAKVISFRRGRQNYTPRHFIIEVQGINNRKEAKTLEGKKVIWISPSGKKFQGTITALHGNKGHVRVVFPIGQGLPGQAINDEVEIE